MASTSCFCVFSGLVLPIPICISPEYRLPPATEFVQCAAVMTQNPEITVPPQYGPAPRLIIVA